MNQLKRDNVSVSSGRDRICLTALLIAVMWLAFACKLGNPFVFTLIASQITIDQNEKEIVFNQPFKPTKQVNRVCFEYDERLNIGSIKEPPKFSDGTSLMLDLRLFDEQNVQYKFSKIGRNREKYICFVPEDYDQWLDIAEKEVTFVRMTVRCNQTLNISKIEWESYNAWDLK